MTDLESSRRPVADRATSAPPRLPDFYMPAMPPLGLITAIENWVRTRVHRRQLKRLLEYDDHILEDMGFPRRDALRRLRRPATTDDPVMSERRSVND